MKYTPVGSNILVKIEYNTTSGLDLSAATSLNKADDKSHFTIIGLGDKCTMGLKVGQVVAFKNMNSLLAAEHEEGKHTILVAPETSVLCIVEED